jgi:hypothetical protein
MPKFKNLKAFMDWVSHGKVIVDIAFAVGITKGLKALLAMFTKIPPVWLDPMEWLTVALLLWALLRFGILWGARSGQQMGSKGQTINSTALANTASPLDAKEILANSFNSNLQVEVETNVRGMIANMSEEEREPLIVKYIASGTLSYIYDQIWWTIFKSQILALETLNQRILRREEVENLYDRAVAEYPSEYANYAFAAWFEYLSRNLLVLVLPGGTVGITKRGTDFLKYLIHVGHSANKRRL